MANCNASLCARQTAETEALTSHILQLASGLEAGTSNCVPHATHISRFSEAVGSVILGVFFWLCCVCCSVADFIGKIACLEKRLVAEGGVGWVDWDGVSPLERKGGGGTTRHPCYHVGKLDDMRSLSVRI